MALTQQGIHPKDLKVSDLRLTHEDYDVYVSEWRFMRAAYDGARALIGYGVLYKHERESTPNHTRRTDEAFGFSYSRSIIDLFNYYLFKEPVKREMGTLGDDELWQMFIEDCDLFGNDFDKFLYEQGKSASIEGHVGILVDKPNIEKTTYVDPDPVDDEEETQLKAPEIASRQDEIENEVYPYVASYRPQTILDWRWERDRFNRPQLTYLKLAEENGTYRLWWRDHWEVWQEPEESDESGIAKTGTKATNKEVRPELDPDMDAVLVSFGPNPLGEIPFIWLINEEGQKRFIGMSDITDIARIDASIIRNLSQGEEIINYAAFPMMRKPNPEVGEVQQEDTVGVTGVLGFDPDKPESKPDWLDAEVGDPVNVILAWIGKKIEEIYRSSNTGGMASMEISTQAKSGAALKAEFQLLNSKLVGKGNTVEDVEISIIDYWTRWQEMEDPEAKVERSDSYEVQDLMADLENILTANTIVKSLEFKKRVQKNVVRMMLPGEPDDGLKVIDKEIDEYDPIKEMKDRQDALGVAPPGDDRGNAPDKDKNKDKDGNVIPFARN